MKDFQDCFRPVLSEYAMKMQKEEDKAFEKDHPEGTNASIEKFINSLSRENKEENKEQVEEFDLEEKIEKLMRYIITLDPFNREFSTANYFIREELRDLYNAGYSAGQERGHQE